VPATTPVLSSEDFPALHRSANQHSLNAQHTFLLWFKIRLGGLVVAAIGGAITWTIHGRHCQLEQSEGDFRRFASAIHQVACDV
jgi:hypothetical protein